MAETFLDQLAAALFNHGAAAGAVALGAHEEVLRVRSEELAALLCPRVVIAGTDVLAVADGRDHLRQELDEMRIHHHAALSILEAINFSVPQSATVNQILLNGLRRALKGETVAHQEDRNG